MKLAAFGDPHIGPYDKKLDSETGLNARLLDTSDSLHFVMMDSAIRQVDGVLFVGDMFRNHKPTPTELVLANKCLSLSRVDTIMIPGNHDLPRCASEHSAIEPLRTAYQDIHNMPTFLDNWHGIQLATLPYPNRAQLAASISGYDKLSPDEADRLIEAHVAAILQGFRARLNPNRPSILLAHISIDLAEAGQERGIMAGRDIAIPLAAIPEEFTFVVLGHIHKAQDFAQYGRPNVLYTGSTDRINFGEEGEEKSYVILDTDAGTYERVPIPCREYTTVDVVFEEGEFRCNHSLDGLKGSICRARIKRPENAKPDYPTIQRWCEEVGGCWDFRGFVEDVQRVAAVRSEEVTRAESIADLVHIWRDSKGVDVPVEDLVAGAQELERMVAA